jgi:hypothetical protein
MRSIQVNLDKPEFTINPTNCDPLSVDSQGVGDQGTVADFSSYFHVDNCAALPFKPAMTVRQVGPRATKRGSNPAFLFDLKTRPGDANIKSLSVSLPAAFEIDQEHLGNLCTEKLLVETQCAGKQEIGEATTTTPLLEAPLKGPVYAVSGSGGLPRLAFILNGQVTLVPRAETVTKKGELVTTAPVIPDAPIGRFSLKIFGGKHGYITNTRNLCARPPRIKIGYTGQNGKLRSQSLKLRIKCGSSSRQAPLSPRLRDRPEGGLTPAVPPVTLPV